MRRISSLGTARSSLVAGLLTSCLLSCGEQASAPGEDPAHVGDRRHVDGQVHLLQLNRLQGMVDGIPCIEDPEPVLAGASELRNSLRDAGDQAYLVCVGDTLVSTKYAPANKIDHMALDVESGVTMEALGAARVDALVPGSLDLSFGAGALLDMAAERGVRLLITNANDKKGLGRVVSSWMPEPSAPDGPRLAFLGAAPTRGADKARKMRSLSDDDLELTNVIDAVGAEAERIRSEHDIDFLVVLSAVAGTTNSKILDLGTVDLVIGSRDASSEVRDIAFRFGAALAVAAPLGKEVGQTIIRVVDNDLNLSDVSEQYLLEEKLKREDIWLGQFVERYGTSDLDQLRATAQADPSIDGAGFAERIAFLEQDRAGLVEMASYTGSAIDHRVAELPKVSADHAVRIQPGAFAERFAAALAQADLPPPQRTLEHPRIPSPDDCYECHQEQYNFWSQTPHAQAFESLRENQRASDPSCLECHSTGFGLEGGYDDVRLEDPLGGVSCFACHDGVSTLHGSNARRTMQPLYVWSIRNEQKCGKCHTERRSPDFDQPLLMDQVACPPMDLLASPIVSTRIEALEILAEREREGRFNDADRFIAARARLAGGISSALDEFLALAAENTDDAVTTVQIARLLDRYGFSKDGQEVARGYLMEHSGEESVNLAYIHMLLFPSDEEAADPDTALTRLKFLIPTDLEESQAKHIAFRCYEVDALYMTGAERKGESLLTELIATQGEDHRIRERVQRWNLAPRLLELARAAAAEAEAKAKTEVPIRHTGGEDDETDP